MKWRGRWCTRGCRVRPLACFSSGVYHLIRAGAQAPSRPGVSTWDPGELQDGDGCSQVMERAGTTLGQGSEALFICNLFH